MRGSRDLSFIKPFKRDPGQQNALSRNNIPKMRILFFLLGFIFIVQFGIPAPPPANGAIPPINPPLAEAVYA